jgi:hypothetical protein
MATYANQTTFTRTEVRVPSHTEFEELFELGDRLFAKEFNALEGGGANVGQGQRFTRVPRADLKGAGEWFNHTPPRVTGPNAQACEVCHGAPFHNGAGPAVMNVHRDPLRKGDLGSFIQRNTPHLFGAGAVQRLAEEMTEELHGIRDRASDEACQTGIPETASLSTKGVDFGSITVPCTGNVNSAAVQGISADLVVRPFQWKGSEPFLRQFNRDAANNELGMQAVELVGDNVDGDFDGVVNELTIGDITALTVYVAAQPRPTTKIELASLGLIGPVSAQEVQSIERGGTVFQSVGCASCHVPKLTLKNPIFSEPSQNPLFRDAVFPSGLDPVARGVDPSHPVTFDLTKDQPSNRIKDAAGNLTFHLGALEKDAQGRAVVELFGDLKRHDMGPGLAESIDEVGTGASVFLTKNLWGVGSTGPYLHDGRATTLTEAILEHGGEAATSRDAFNRLGVDEQKDLVAYLQNRVLFKSEMDEVKERSEALLAGGGAIGDD